MKLSARFGAELHRSGVTFRLWAPAAKRVEVLLDRAYPMQAGAQARPPARFAQQSTSSITSLTPE